MYNEMNELLTDLKNLKKKVKVNKTYIIKNEEGMEKRF